MHLQLKRTKAAVYARQQIDFLPESSNESCRHSSSPDLHKCGWSCIFPDRPPHLILFQRKDVLEGCLPRPKEAQDTSIVSTTTFFLQLFTMACKLLRLDTDRGRRIRLAATRNLNKNWESAAHFFLTVVHLMLRRICKLAVKLFAFIS